jgi:hypothetical protein
MLQLCSTIFTHLLERDVLSMVPWEYGDSHAPEPEPHTCHNFGSRSRYTLQHNLLRYNEPGFKIDDLEREVFGTKKAAAQLD